MCLLGKVPALDTGSRIVTESLDICDFLEEQYPKPPLYPADPTALQKDKELIKSFDTLTSKLVEVWFNKNNRTLLEHVRDAVPELQRLENELINRGNTFEAFLISVRNNFSCFQGTFFGGDVPGMADYMLWPWAERATTFPLLYKEEFPLPDDSFQKLRAWFKAMQKVKVIQETQISPETFYKLVLKFKGGQKIAYDEL